jgi:ParB family chromosome partitioning protein
MQVPIEEITVKRRVRQELGDLDALAESMKRYGQINPLIVTKQKVLIAGFRRLQAAKILGWHAINVVIADLPGRLAKLEWEVEENFQRRDFTPAELAEASRRIHRLRNPSFLARIWNAIVGFFKRLFHIED